MDMDDRRALMAAIIADPDDDTPRLAFADWLQEHGDEHDQARAEFIRLQCRHAQLSASDPQKSMPYPSAVELQSRHATTWLKPLGKFLESQRSGQTYFSRGLLANLGVLASEFATKEFQQSASEGLPVVGVKFLDVARSCKRLETVIDSPALAWVSCFGLRRFDHPDQTFALVARSSHLCHLSELWIESQQGTDDGLALLGSSQALPSLRRLSFRGGRRSRQTTRGFLDLLESKKLVRLHELDISDMSRAVGWNDELFFASPALLRLTRLDLGGRHSFTILARCDHLANLETLYLREVTASDDDVVRFLSNPTFSKLKRLWIGGPGWNWEISDTGVQLLRDRFGANLFIE
jgi:uncharacterized protein (TIGR02996 family)